MNRPLGEGDFDPFFPEALQNPVGRLMLHMILVHEFPDPGQVEELKFGGGGRRCLLLLSPRSGPENKYPHQETEHKTCQDG